MIQTNIPWNSINSTTVQHNPSSAFNHTQAFSHIRKKQNTLECAKFFQFAMLRTVCEYSLCTEYGWRNALDKMCRVHVQIMFKNMSHVFLSLGYGVPWCNAHQPDCKNVTTFIWFLHKIGSTVYDNWTPLSELNKVVGSCAAGYYLKYVVVAYCILKNVHALHSGH